MINSEHKLIMAIHASKSDYLKVYKSKLMQVYNFGTNWHGTAGNGEG